MILSAQTIRSLCVSPLLGVLRQGPMIHPFHERTELHGMTFGLSSAGYDVRVAEEINLIGGDFVLASTIERFDIPNDVVGIVHDKSSWARRGIAVQNTVIESGWRGHLTLELSKHSLGYLMIPAGSPIAQIVFHRLDEPTCQPYSGKYQNQEPGPQAAR